MVKFTLKQCQYFLATAEHGGIAQAARALHISQPSVAQGLAKLEQVTGLVLFQRQHARGMQLSAQGRAFHRHVMALMHTADHVAHEAQALAAEQSGEIRLGCFFTIAALCLPGLIRSHKEQYPDISIVAHENTLEQIAVKVHTGELDMGLSYDIGDHLNNLTRYPLASIAPIVLLPAQHALATKANISLQELAQEPFITFDAPDSKEFFQNLLSDAGIAPPIAYTSSSLQGVLNAVSNGFGFSIIVLCPPLIAPYYHIRAISIADPIEPIKLVLATRKSFAQSAITEQFISHARQYLAGENLLGFTLAKTE